MGVHNQRTLWAFVVKEILRMLNTLAAFVNRILGRFGITILISSGPLTDDEWDQMKVLPLYREWLKNGGDEGAEYLSPEDVEAFRRGEIPFSAIGTVKKVS
ncbi:MAG TPA: hypothetical protein VKQ72_06415 [Aggregatilineales bacterium]|nr:hypothetical protein [Aggregatilineales bacterium]